VKRGEFLSLFAAGSALSAFRLKKKPKYPKPLDEGYSKFKHKRLTILETPWQRSISHVGEVKYLLTKVRGKNYYATIPVLDHEKRSEIYPERKKQALVALIDRIREDD
jgi:hypothetical protein